MSKLLKLAISSSEESATVQMLLYSKGYRWANGHKNTPIHTETPFLYLDDRVITYGTDQINFDRRNTYEKISPAYFTGNTLRQRVQDYATQEHQVQSPQP